MKTNYKTNIIALAILLMGTITTAFAQDEQSNALEEPDVLLRNITSSPTANVLTFNYDKSHDRNENFYVVYGRKKAKMGKWMEDIKFEVQREGLAGTRHGMFADWHHLRLVANWDNSEDPANIIFGFDSNKQEQLREEMTLTDDGRLIVGRHQHNINSYNDKAFNLVATYDNGRKSYTDDRLQVYGNIRLGGSKKLGSGRIKNWGVMEFLADDDKSHDRIYKFYGYNKPENNEGESEYVVFNAKAERNMIKGETILNTLHLKDNDLKENYITFNSKLKKNRINGKTFFGDDVLAAKDFTVGRDFNFTGNVNFNATEKAQTMNVMSGLQIVLKNSGPKNTFKIGSVVGANALYVGNTGKIGMGTDTPSEKLHVDGKIKASGFLADASAFPDYVFANDYELAPLSEVKKFVTTNKHLPNMPSEKEVITNGLDLKKVTTVSVEKIEELYLYTIKQQELIEKLTKRIDQLEKRQK